MKRLLLIAALLLARPALATVTFDSTACASGTAANCPHTANATGAVSSVTTGAISTGTANILVVAVMTGENSPLHPTSSVTSTGSTSVAWAQVCASDDPASASGTFVDIWSAVTSGTWSGATVTANFTGVTSGSMYVYFISSGSTTLGVSTCANTTTASGVAGMTLAGTTSGSVVLGATMDGFNGAAMTANGSTTVIRQYLDSPGDRYADIMLTNPSGGGSVTVGGTWGAGGKGAAALVEILDAGGGPPPFPALRNKKMTGVGR